jgi:orotidine-5'-phosphate decarboxylase
MAGILSTGYVTHEDTNKVDALKRFADACHEVGTRPCGVTVLTSKSDDIVNAEFNGRSSIEQVLYYVEVLAQCGFTDVVCSPLEMEAICSESRFDKLDMNTPGIVMPGADQRDQARTNTPGKAIAAGATRVVVGSALTKGDPTENFKAIVANIAETQV